jgi:hypothetical protein
MYSPMNFEFTTCRKQFYNHLYVLGDDCEGESRFVLSGFLASHLTL